MKNITSTILTRSFIYIQSWHHDFSKFSTVLLFPFLIICRGGRKSSASRVSPVMAKGTAPMHSFHCNQNQKSKHDSYQVNNWVKQPAMKVAHLKKQKVCPKRPRQQLTTTIYRLCSRLTHDLH